MKCKDVMKRDVVSCRPDHSAEQCARGMRDNNLGFMPVLDEQGKVIGTITDRDLAIRILADGRDSNTRIEQAMTRDVVCCRPEDDLSDAEGHMERTRKSRMLVVDDDGRCQGVISLSDIAQKEETKRTGEILRSVTRREAVAV